jgi:hypothetical protein
MTLHIFLTLVNSQNLNSWFDATAELTILLIQRFASRTASTKSFFASFCCSTMENISSLDGFLSLIFISSAAQQQELLLNQWILLLHGFIM